MTAERDLGRLLATMEPAVRPGQFVFVTVTSTTGLAALATVDEAEGISCVVTKADADEHELAYTFVAGWITLEVHSALDAVGLTAAVATALAAAGISCNVIAGSRHDHLLVPHERVDDAITVLRDLSKRGS